MSSLPQLPLHWVHQVHPPGVLGPVAQLQQEGVLLAMQLQVLPTAHLHASEDVRVAGALWHSEDGQYLLW